MGDKFYGNMIVYIGGKHEVLKFKVIWESNNALGAECRTGQGECKVRVRIVHTVLVMVRVY